MFGIEKSSDASLESSSRSETKMKKILPYLILPLWLIIYELATLIVMHTHTFASVLFNPYNLQNSFISMFWYDGYVNVLGLVVFIFILSCSFLYLPKDQRYIRAFSVVFIVFAIGYLANFKSTSYSYGQSGIVFALTGMTISLIVSDSIYAIIKQKQYEVLMMNIGPMLILTSAPILQFNVVFNVSSQIDYVVHEYAFLYGIIAGFILSIIQEVMTVHAREEYNFDNAMASRRTVNMEGEK